MYGLNTAKILWQLLDLARRRYKRYDDVQLPTQTLSLLLCGSYWLQQGELPAIIQNQLRIHKCRSPQNLRPWLLPMYLSPMWSRSEALWRPFQPRLVSDVHMPPTFPPWCDLLLLQVARLKRELGALHGTDTVALR